MKPKSKQESERSATFARGGVGPTNKMFKEQAAGPVKSGIAGKVENKAPGARSATGGPQQRGHSKSTPALAGHSGPAPKKER